MRFPYWSILVTFAILWMPLAGIAKDQKGYELGKLVDVQSEAYDKLVIVSNSETGAPLGTTVRRTDNLISVRLGDLIIVGECIGKRHWSSCKPGEWVIGDPIDVRIDQDTMYLKKPNGKEMKTKIVKRVRADSEPEQK